MCASDERLTSCNDNSDCVSCVINDVVTFALFLPDCDDPHEPDCHKHSIMCVVSIIGHQYHVVYQ
jgi:hypothetical protein